MTRTLFILSAIVATVFISGCSTVPSSIEQSPKNTVALEKVKPLATEFTETQELEFALDVVDLELKNQRWDKAFTLLKKLKRFYPEDARIYRRYVRYYQYQNDRTLAYVSAKALMKKEGVTHKDQSMAARLALLNDDFSMADKIYQAWLETDEQAMRVTALNNLGFSALLQKKPDAARQYFQKALALDPLHEKARNNLALLNRQS